MKRKTRTITVNNQQYIWWHEFSEKCAIIHFSPINDKTSKITVKFSFEYEVENDGNHHFADVFPEYVIMTKDNKEYHIKTIEPKMASLILSYLSYDTFISRKNITYDGLDILSKMGYTISKVKAGWYW